MKPYRVAIMGTGNTANGHINDLSQSKDRVEIVAAMDIDEGRVKAFCETHNIPRWFTNAEDLLSVVQPDLVHVVTPPSEHTRLSIASLEAGAWVFCEKPLCLSLAEFDRISEAEQRTGRYVSTVFQWRFGSAGKHLKRLIENGELGRPLVGVCQTLWYRAMPYYQLPWRGQWTKEAGGAASTLGIHLTELFLWLMSDNWREVHAIVETLDRPIEVENVAMALVRFENGAVGNITSSAVSPRQESYLRLDFQRATVDVTALYRYSNENWRYAIYDGSPDGAELERWRKIEADVPSTRGVQLAELLDSMDQNQRPAVSGAEARRILEFLASMYKSAFTGTTVQRGTITPDDPFYHAMNGNQQMVKNT